MPENPQTLQQKKDYLKSVTIDKNSILNGINTQSIKSADKASDPFRQAQVTSFNAGPSGLQFDRYYSHPAYNRLGFNPYVDNESNYNKNSTKFEDFQRSTSQWTRLFGIGFSSAFTGKSSVQQALDYEEASRIGSTSRGGAFGTLNNAYLNSGYTVGLIGEIAVEEVALGALTLFSGGTASGLAEARTVQNASRLGKAFTSVNSFSKNLFRTAERVNDLKDIGKAKSFYEGVKKGLGVVNPLKGTTDFITASRAGQLDNISSMAKVTKGFGSFYRDIREINLSLGESKLEAGFTNNTVSRDLYNEYLQKNGKAPESDDLERIQDLASKASKSTYVMNAGLIYATNKIAFDGFFRKFKPKFGSETLIKNDLGKVVANKSFMKTGQDAFQFVKKGIVPEFKQAFSKAGIKQAPLNTLKFLAKYTKTNFSEGAQEWLQEVVQDAEVQKAKDDYYGAVRGGYYDYYSRSMSKLMDTNGLDVFTSGFIMGGVVAPITHLQGYGAQKVTDLGNRVFQPGKYKDQKEYKQDREKSFQEQIDKLNEMTKSPTKYFNMGSLNNLVNQVNHNNTADNLASNKKEKEFRDTEDQSVGESLLFAMKSGMYDNFIDQLESMGQMSEEDLRDAFTDTPEQGVTSLSSFKENSTKIIERAKTLKQFYDNVNSRFQNPFQVQDTNLGDDDEKKTQQIKYQAYESAKDAIILNQYNFSRTLDRMTSISEDLKTNNPFWKTSTIDSNDVSLLFNKEDLDREVVLLREEVSNIEGNNSVDKSDIQKKKEKLKQLEKFKDAHDAYRFVLEEESSIRNEVDTKRKLGIGIGSEVIVNTKAGGKAHIVAEVTMKGGKPAWLLSDGRRVLQSKVDMEGYTYESEALDPITKNLKSNFDSYMGYLASSTNNYTDHNKLDSAFQKLIDLYSLGQDSSNMSSLINKLVDHKGFSSYVDRQYQIYKYRWDSRKEELKSSLRAFQSAAENNELVQQIAKNHGAFIVEDDLERLVDDNIIPEEFYDINTLESITKNSKRYTDIVSEINEFFVKTGRIPDENEPIVDIQEEVKPSTNKKVTLADIESSINEDGTSTLPSDLQKIIEDSYSNYVKSVSEKGLVPVDIKTWASSESGGSSITPILESYNSNYEESPKEQVKTTEDKLVEAGTDYYDPGIDLGEETPQDKPTIELELDNHTKEYITSGKKATLIRSNSFANSIGLGKPLESAYFFITNKEGKEERYSISNTGFHTVGEVQGKDFMVKMEGLPTESNDIYKYPIESDGKTYYTSEESTIKWLLGNGKMVVLGINYDPEVIPIVETDLQAITKFDKEFIPRIEQAKTANDIFDIERDLLVASANLIRQHGITLDNYIPNLLARKLEEINTDLSIDNIATNEVLVLKGKMANFGTVVVNSKGQTKKGTKYIRVKSISNPELDEAAIYESQTSSMISQKGANAIAQTILSSDDQSLLDQTTKNQDLLLDNKEEIKRVINEAKNQSLDDINGEFLDSLGCK